MCGDRYDPPIGFVCIKEYFEALMETTQRAVDMARLDMERRMKDFPEQFVKKGEVGEILSKLSSKVEALEKTNNQLEGKASYKALEIVRWVSITGIILSIIGILLRFFKV
jgi:hypothetical protein